MSLTKQAIGAIIEYRKAILINPTEIESESLLLKDKCLSLGRQDQNFFYNVNANSFGSGQFGFPSAETFDREEYLTFRYLYESSHYLRKVMYKNQKTNLEKLIADVDQANPELTNEYDRTYGIWVSEGLEKRTLLKIESTKKGLSNSKNFFIFQKVALDPNAYGQDLLHWVYPNDFRSDLYFAFKNSSKEIACSWGVNSNLINFYMAHIDAKKMGEKIAIFSGVSAGTLLAAWGISQMLTSNRSSESAVFNNTLMSSASVQAADILASANLSAHQNYGFENFPGYYAPQSSQLMANQAGFLNHLQPSTGTNRYDFQIAALKSLDSAFNADYLSNTAPIQTMLPSLGISNTGGDILGCKAMLSELTSPNGNMTQVYGTINGKNIFKTFQKIGNTIYIN